MTIKKDIRDLKQEADIMVSKQFRKKVKDLLIKEEILRNHIDLSIVDTNLRSYFDDKIKEIEKKINQPDPLDEIFLTDRETKLKKQLVEQKSINEHIRMIYKRDLKKDINTLIPKDVEKQGKK